MTEVIMPKMGDGMDEGTLLEWLKADGAPVTKGEVIGTIQTDKATLELESPGAGKLTGILISPGETVPVGRAIAAIIASGEELPKNWGSGAAAQAVVAAATETTTNGTTATASSATAGSAGPSPTDPPAGRIKASPLAKKVAEQQGIDLSSIVGSGPGGRIVEKDVLGGPPAKVAIGTPATAIVASTEDRTIQLNKMRQITAQRTQQSKQQVPHFYVTVEVDVERIMALRQTFEEEGSGKVSINDFVVKACALALRDMPEVNASFQDKTVLEHSGVHVGIAVALPEGLTVPVLKNADRLSLRQISVRAKELAGKAKENKLSLDELTGSTFSISNMGMLDVDNFLAIVNQPNAAIVAIASARKRVVVGENDELEIRHMMNISGSFDHRVADGAVGAKFVNVVKAYLQNPTRLMS